MAIAPEDVKLDRVLGSLLGTALGDALGLPTEGLQPARAKRMHGERLRHRFLFGRGMMSDDGEHACLVLEAIARAKGVPEQTQRRFAQMLRFWLLGIPAGIGYSTLKAILRLWIGIKPPKSASRSASNGAAMRAAVIGALFDDLEEAKRMVDAVSRVTHAHPLAVQGAQIVAYAAHALSRYAYSEADGPALIGGMIEQIDLDSQWDEPLLAAAEALRHAQTPEEFAAAQGWTRGPSGYVLQSVPAALFCALRYLSDFKSAVSGAICMGGDTDTVAAMAGGIVGARGGAATLPRDLMAGLWEWPRTPHFLHQLAAAAVKGNAPPRAPLPLIWPRNMLFLATVLAHGFRRLLPL
jgi:ADP-ribosyl-[dinitrogen reductase] hydrolase